MKYVSIDIETTGIEYRIHQILEIGAIIEDPKNQLSFEDSPKFHAIVLPKNDLIIGSAYALRMNKRIIDILAERSTLNGMVEISKFDKEFNIMPRNVVAYYFHTFLQENYYSNIENSKRYNKPIKINVAGKNFGSFDKNFLNRLPGIKETINFGHRFIDPAMQFTEVLNDEKIPSLDKCMELAGIEGRVRHTALDDAWDVIRLLRTKYRKLNDK